MKELTDIEKSFINANYTALINYDSAVNTDIELEVCGEIWVSYDNCKILSINEDLSFNVLANGEPRYINYTNCHILHEAKLSVELIVNIRPLYYLSYFKEVGFDEYMKEVQNDVFNNFDSKIIEVSNDFVKFCKDNQETW